MTPSHTRYFRLDRRDLAYLTFILESYEGLATLTTVEKKQETLVSLTPPHDFTADLDDLITALRKEITMKEAAPPPDARAAEGESHA